MASTIYLQTEILYKDLSLFQEEMSGYIMGLNHTQVSSKMQNFQNISHPATRRMSC